MSTPDLPQPFYPGKTPPAPPTQLAPPTAPSPPVPPYPQPYAPTPGGPSGPGGPGGMGGGGGQGGSGGSGGQPPNRPATLKIVIAVAAVVAVVVVGIFVVRGFGTSQGASGQSTQSGSEPNQPGTGQPEPDPPGTSEAEPGPTQDSELVAAVNSTWGAQPSVQNCIVETVSGNSDLSAAVKRVVNGGFSTTDAQNVAQVNVDCASFDELSDMVMMSDVTPYCEYYDFSILSDDDWVVLVGDLYQTLGGIFSVEEFQSFYFPTCVQ